MLTEKKESRFHTVVPTVARFPIPILMLGWFMALVNTSFGVSFLLNAASVIPGLAATGADQQAAIMLAARNLGQGFILIFALLYKNVRVLQMVWLMGIIREAFDLIAPFARGDGAVGPGPVIVVAILIAEIAAFTYLGLIASGRIASYNKGH